LSTNEVDELEASGKLFIRLVSLDSDLTMVRVFDDHVSRDPEYPSTIPSTGDSPEYLSLKKIFQHGSRQDSPMRDLEHSTYASGNDTDDLRTSFAPPGYVENCP